jgi:Domain of unknown function (DUF4129)
VAHWRLPVFALFVTALVAVVALAARGGPFRSGGGGSGGAVTGPAPVFYDYLWTTVVILVLFSFAAVIAGVWLLREERGKPRSGWSMLRSLVSLLVIASIGVFFSRHLHFQRLPGGQGDSGLPGRALGGGSGSNGAAGQSRGVQFQWPELVGFLALLLVLGALLYVDRVRPGPPKKRRDASETVALALDESLDDLRTDPDLRRAIVAAYARMERALAGVGLRRHPAEAPLEYLERALVSLESSAEAVRRLTDLFEWARFSHHEPDPAMRDEAVDALIAVRDELRASELTPA